MRIGIVRASYFLWLIVPAGLLAATYLIGTPHLRWSYRFIDQGQGLDPFAARHYTRCTYLGWERHFTIHHPPGGHCPLIRFAK